MNSFLRFLGGTSLFLSYTLNAAGAGSVPVKRGPERSFGAEYKASMSLVSHVAGCPSALSLSSSSDQKSFKKAGYTGGADGHAIADFYKKLTSGEGSITTAEERRWQQLYYSLCKELNEIGLLIEASPVASIEVLRKQLIDLMQRVVHGQAEYLSSEKQKVILDRCSALLNGPHAAFIFKEDCDRRNLDNTQILFKGLVYEYCINDKDNDAEGFTLEELSNPSKTACMRGILENILTEMELERELPHGVTCNMCMVFIEERLANKHSLLSAVCASLEQGYPEGHVFLNQVYTTVLRDVFKDICEVGEELAFNEDDLGSGNVGSITHSSEENCAESATSLSGVDGDVIEPQVLRVWYQLASEAINLENLERLDSIKRAVKPEHWVVLMKYHDPREGNTLLHSAIYHESFTAVRFLLEHGAHVSINSKNLKDETPLMYTILFATTSPERSLAITRLLCEHGALESINIDSSTCGLPVHAVFAIFFKIKSLYQGKPLFVQKMAAINDLIDLLLHYSSQEALCSKHIPTGNTALHIAVMFCSARIVEQLLHKGAQHSLSVENNQGFTPLAYLKAKKREEQKSIEKLLVQASKELEAQKKEELNKKKSAQREQQEALKKKKIADDAAALQAVADQEKKTQAEARAVKNKIEQEKKQAREQEEKIKAEKRQKEEEALALRRKSQQETKRKKEQEKKQAKREQKKANKQNDAQGVESVILEPAPQPEKEPEVASLTEEQAPALKVQQEAELKAKVDAELVRVQEEQVLKDKAEAAKVVADILAAQEQKVHAALMLEQEVKGKQEAAVFAEEGSADVLALREEFKKELFKPASLTKKLLQDCCQNGVSLDCADEYGNTPLAIAGVCRDQKAIDLLLAAGANPSHGTKVMGEISLQFVADQKKKREEQERKRETARTAMSRPELALRCQRLEEKFYEVQKGLLPRGLAPDVLEARKDKLRRDAQMSCERLIRSGAMGYIPRPNGSALSPMQQHQTEMEQARLLEQQRLLHLQQAQVEAKESPVAQASVFSLAQAIEDLAIRIKSYPKHRQAVTSQELQSSLKKLLFQAVYENDHAAVLASFTIPSIDIKNFKDENGNTILMAAVDHGHVDMFNLLLIRYRLSAEGLKPYQKNRYGETLSTLAARRYVQTARGVRAAIIMKILIESNIHFTQRYTGDVSAASLITAATHATFTTDRCLSLFLEKEINAYRLGCPTY